MSLAQWQAALRREFGREQRFKLKNLGDEPVFSEFEVSNPATKGTYRVAIRGSRRATTTARAPTSPSTRWAPASTSSSRWPNWSGGPDGKRALAAGFQPPYSEMFLRYGAKRE